MLLYIISCTPLVNYSIIGDNFNLIINMYGTRAYQESDSTRFYPVHITDKEGVNYKFGAEVFFLNANLLFKNEIFLGAIKKYESYQALEFINLPFDFIPSEDKHIIEITLLTKDSVEHLLKYQSK